SLRLHRPSGKFVAIFLAISMADATQGLIAKNRIDTVPRFRFRDPLIEGIGRALCAELGPDGSLGRLYAESLANSMGLAPHQYVLEQRIDRAKTLLSETALSLTEIAYRLGFASQSHFTAVFRRLTSTTPEAYRKHR